MLLLHRSENSTMIASGGSFDAVPSRSVPTMPTCSSEPTARRYDGPPSASEIPTQGVPVGKAVEDGNSVVDAQPGRASGGHRAVVIPSISAPDSRDEDKVSAKPGTDRSGAIPTCTSARNGRPRGPAARALRARELGGQVVRAIGIADSDPNLRPRSGLRAAAVEPGTDVDDSARSCLPPAAGRAAGIAQPDSVGLVRFILAVVEHRYRERPVRLAAPKDECTGRRRWPSSPSRISRCRAGA